MWVANAKQLLDTTSGAQRITNYFMDGPYSFEIQKTERDYLTLRFMKNAETAREREEMPALDVTLADYGTALYRALEELLEDPTFQEFDKERMLFQQYVASLKALL